ncbi:MAG TPA: AfsA-related hotdog domain-containing protein [Solirubrobacteraceae bacterium]|nr:AfsA-related hotdog domain-containing protein [Solirubrobacteraceae bacterium]
MRNAPSAAKPDQRRQLSSTPETAWLRFDRNVPRDLVHRRALAEVLIADTVQVADDEFLLGTQLPRAHTLWSDRQYPYHDPLITVEVCRQACIATLHRYYNVPPEWQFLSKRIDFRVVNLDAYADDHASPPEGILRARILNKRERAGTLLAITIESELTIDGTLGGTVSGDVIVMQQPAYQRLRAQQLKIKYESLATSRTQEPVRPVDPSRVGRILQRNVAIGDGTEAVTPSGECRYNAVVDQTHPCFFDHPLDHLPGALIMEIHRQTAIDAAGSAAIGMPASAVITRCDVQLSDFAELETHMTCSATLVGQPQPESARVVSRLHQFDSQIGDGQVELRFVQVDAHA